MWQRENGIKREDDSGWLFSCEQASCSYMIHNPMIVLLHIGKKKCYSQLLHLKAIMNAAAQSMAILRLKGYCKKNQGIPIGQTRTCGNSHPTVLFHTIRLL